MLDGDESVFYERIRASADRIARRSLRRDTSDSSEKSSGASERRQELSELSGGTEESPAQQITPEVLVVARALRHHGMIHINGLPSDEYDCCAEVAIQAYEHYKKSILRDRRNTIYSPLLND